MRKELINYFMLATNHAIIGVDMYNLEKISTEWISLSAIERENNKELKIKIILMSCSEAVYSAGGVYTVEMNRDLNRIIRTRIK